MSFYLTDKDLLNFSGLQAGIILGITALSNLVGPFLSAYVIDRKVHAKHIYLLVMAIMIASSISLIFIRDYVAVLIAVFFLYVSFGPALSISHSTTFQEIKEWRGGTANFGKVRVWGTVSWIVCGFFATGIWLAAPLVFPAASQVDQKALAFILAVFGAVMSILVFSKTPKSELQKDAPKGLIPKGAFSVIKKPIVLGYGIVFSLSQILESFYYFGQGPYLNSQGYSSEVIPAVLTIGQVLEIPMLFFFAALLKRVGYYNVFLIGAVTQALRYALFLTGVPALSLVAYALNGIIFACVWNAITMFIDKHADEKNRNGVHQLIGLFFGGTSWLIGQFGAGLIFDTIDKSHIDYTGFWSIPLVGSLIVLALVVLFLRKPTIGSEFNKG